MADQISQVTTVVSSRLSKPWAVAGEITVIEAQHETLVALFETRSEAESAVEQVRSFKMEDVAVELLEPGQVSRLEEFAELDVEAVGKDIVASAGLGAAGAAGAAMLAGITFLASGPVAAALIGAGLGADAGAAGGRCGFTRAS